RCASASPVSTKSKSLVASPSWPSFCASNCVNASAARVAPTWPWCSSDFVAAARRGERAPFSRVCSGRSLDRLLGLFFLAFVFWFCFSLAFGFWFCFFLAFVFWFCFFLAFGCPRHGVCAWILSSLEFGYIFFSYGVFYLTIYLPGVLGFF